LRNYELFYRCLSRLDDRQEISEDVIFVVGSWNVYYGG